MAIGSRPSPVAELSFAIGSDVSAVLPPFNPEADTGIKGSRAQFVSHAACDDYTIIRENVRRNQNHGPRNSTLDVGCASSDHSPTCNVFAPLALRSKSWKTH